MFSHPIDICTVAIKNIRIWHAVSTFQITDILDFNNDQEQPHVPIIEMYVDNKVLLLEIRKINTVLCIILKKFWYF